VHAALKRVLRADTVRHIADRVAQHVSQGDARAVAKSRLGRRAALAELWEPVREFLEESQAAYRNQLFKSQGKQAAQVAMSLPSAMQGAFHELFGAALQLPELESLLPAVWPAAARRVLPSESPEAPVERLWAPVLASCLVMLFGESLRPGGARESQWSATGEAFERLRLRQPLAEAFEALGLEGEQPWQAAARVRLVLLQQDDTSLGGKAASWMGLSSAIWRDPEARWLLGWNEWQEHFYIAKEPYEELLWWMMLPDLCHMSGKIAEDRERLARLHTSVTAPCGAMAELHYCVDEIATKKRGVEAASVKDAPALQPREQEVPKAGGNLLTRRGKASTVRRKARKHRKKKPKK
jgi:hypothetical protein